MGEHRQTPRRAGRGLYREVVLLLAALGLAGSAAAQAAAPLVLDAANGAAGVQFLEPGRWGLIRSVVSNHETGGGAIEPLVCVNAADGGGSEFASRVWVPASSRREVLTPFLPGKPVARKPALELKTRLIAAAPGGERAVAMTSGAVALRDPDSRFDSAILSDREDELPNALVVALRSAAGLKPTNVRLEAGDAPATPEAYDGLDCLFVSARTPGLDARRMDALRRWVRKGGRVWVMLDEVSPAWAAALLGEQWDVGVIDTVEATQFSIRGLSAETRQDLEYGVPLVRALAPNFVVTHWVGDQPAAMHRQIGRGEVLITLLGARGWLTESLQATAALKDLQSFIAGGGRVTAANSPPAVMGAFDEHARSQIGYRVIDRRLIGTVLGGAAVGLLLAGAVCSRRSRIELAAPFGVVGAIGASVVLVMLGAARQSQTPTTVSVAQLLRFDGRIPRAECEQRLSVYTAPADAGKNPGIKLTGGGVLYPDARGAADVQTGSRGRSVRLVWTDAEHLAVEGVEARAGSLREFVASGEAMVSSAAGGGVPNATIALGASGLTGMLQTCGLQGFASPILATPMGCVALHLANDGGLAAGVEDVLEPGVFTRSTLLTGTEASQQRVLEKLLRRPGFLAGPSILGWASALPSGLDAGASAVSKGTALVVIPVTIDPPRPGAQVSVPAPLIGLSPVRGAIGKRSVSAVYDPETLNWLGGIHQSMLVLMRFELPASLRGLMVGSATLTLDIHAPGFDVDIVASDGQSVRKIAAGSRTPGATRYELSGSDIQTNQAGGPLLLGVDVRSNTGKGKGEGEGWTIRQMYLSVSGRMP